MNRHMRRANKSLLGPKMDDLSNQAARIASALKSFEGLEEAVTGVQAIAQGLEEIRGGLGEYYAEVTARMDQQERLVTALITKFGTGSSEQVLEFMSSWQASSEGSEAGSGKGGA